MFEIKTEMVVERHRWTRRGRQPYGYCEDQGEYQLLVKKWKWLGVTIFRWTLDREEIPASIWVSRGTLGYASGHWESKFKDFLPIA